MQAGDAGLLPRAVIIVEPCNPIQSIQDQLLHRNVKRFLGRPVFKAQRRVYHSTLGWRVVKKKKKKISKLRMAPAGHIPAAVPALPPAMRCELSRDS